MHSSFNRRLAAIGESRTLALSQKAQRLKESGVRVFDLTAGELSFDPPADLRRAVARAAQQGHYTPIAGDADVREMVARAESQKRNRTFGAEQVVLTAGAKQALAVALQTLLNEGDEVIVPTPSWVSYESQVLLCGGVPKFVPLDPDTFDLNVRALAQQVTKKTKVIILNSPHNPTGSIFSSRALKSLASLARTRKLWVISDDIYESLADEKPVPHISTYLKEGVVLVNGFSKSHAVTGWRIGYLVADTDFIPGCTTIMSHTSGNVSSLSQAAAREALRRPSPASYVRALARRRRIATELISQDSRLLYIKPRAGFYLFVDVSAVTKDTTALCDTLLAQAGVALVPGEAFHAPGFVRISCAADEKQVREGITQFIQHIHTL